MTRQQARAHIEAAFKAEWGAAAPIDYGNDMAAVPAAPFVRLAVRHAGEARAQAMTGSRIRYERSGIVFVQVFTALGIGSAIADQLAKRAADILEGREFEGAEDDALNLGAASQNDVGNNDQGHWQVNVSIPFTFNENRVPRNA